MGSNPAVKAVRSLDGFAIPTKTPAKNPLPQKTITQTKPLNKLKAKLKSKSKIKSKSPTKLVDSNVKVIRRSDGVLPKNLVIPKSPMIQRFSPVIPASVQVEHDSVAEVANLAPPMISERKPVESVISPIERKESMLQAALAGAPSDLRKLDEKVENFSKSHKRAINVVFVTGCLVVVAGLFGYINIARASVRIAAAKAGISASLPEYTAGYNQSGKVAYAPGQVEVSFNSSVLGDRFSLSQKKTLWDSQSLLANHVLKLTPEYQTYRDRGLTIYIWGQGRAAWIDQGMMYEITQDNNLSTEQILKIATSL